MQQCPGIKVPMCSSAREKEEESMDTQDEICRSYRLAKNKPKQIQIMAELNGVSKEEIIKTLVRGGEIPDKETESAQNTGSKVGVPSEPAMMPCMPMAVRDALFKRIDELEQQIKPLERQMEALRSEYGEILGFLKGHRCDDAEIEMHSVQ